MKHSFVLLASVLSVQSAIGQGTQSDYDRANQLRELTRDKVFRDRVDAKWVDDHHFWYRVRIAKDQYEFVTVDAKAGRRQTAFDHQAIAKQLSEQTKGEVNPHKLPFSSIRFFSTDNSIEFDFRGHWKVDRKTNMLTRLKSDETRQQKPLKFKPSKQPRRGSPSGRKSPDGKWEVVVKEHNLYLKDLKQKDAAEIQLSNNGTEKNGYRNGGTFWSPDSKKIIALRTKRGQEHPVSFVESSPKETVQPKLHTHQYLKPGDEIPQPKPHLFDVESHKEIEVSDKHFPNPWLSRPRIEWSDDASRCFYVYNQRGHQVLRVLAIDADSGEVSVIVNEEPKTFVDYAYKQYLQINHDTNDLIWMSERDGWNHLYLIDSNTGKIKHQITKGDWVVRGIEFVDVEKRQIWFRASGLNPKQDPYYIHYCRVNFDGKDFVELTTGDGTHNVKLSPNGEYLIDTYSRVDAPPTTELRRTDKEKLVCLLETANADLLEKTGWRAPEKFIAKGRDDKTDIYGIILRPTNFDPNKNYPIIEKIYAGPHGSFVPKQFRPHLTAQSVAELGFIVVQIDGMGTSNRSKAFHDVCWKNLGDSGFPDRILWVKAAAKKYPYMDITRVGIYGGSAGGQSSTRAMLAFGDFYKVAVSDCGCHDNRMDKIWWNELWMSWPIGPHYEEQSNVTQAHRLTGKLFLTVGELDRNVDPASTMQVVNALIKANKDFDLLVVPGAGHGVGESPYGKRRRRDFFVRHLLGVEPRR